MSDQMSIFYPISKDPDSKDELDMWCWLNVLYPGLL